MGVDFQQGPKMVHPEEPSAVGSRNSLNRDGREEYTEARQIIDEEVDKILNHVQSKLPPEVLQELEVKGNIKSTLHTYFNQSFQNMLGRYLTTVEDEFSKKVRDLLDKQEHATLNRYTPREISNLVNSIGGTETFNTGEVEKSVVNIMGHLQGHIQRGMYEVEARTTNLLMQRTDVGRFIRGENAYSVVKGSFRNNLKKPDSVMDIKLAVNILASELLSPIYLHQLTADHLLKNVIATQISILIDREVDEINEQLTTEGRSSLTDKEALFEKIKSVENHTDDDTADKSKRYQLISQAVQERIEGLGAELSTNMDALGVGEAVSQLLEDEHLRTQGWYTAINSITAILDQSQMGYQHIHNFKNARHLQLREYQETDINRLPDERYEIDLRYFSTRQLAEERVAYSAQMVEFRRETMRLWDVVEAVYQEEKATRNLKDWDSLQEATINRNNPTSRRGWFRQTEEGEPEPEPAWNEVTFVQRKLTTLEEMNHSYLETTEEFMARFIIMRNRMEQIFELNYPEHRVIIDKRLNFLEDQFLNFVSTVNPYHVQPGLLLEITISTIKRNQSTVKGMSNVLNEYLSGISKGFTDRAIASYHRRSHVSDEVVAFGESAAE